MSIAKDFVEALKPKQKTSGYDTTGTVNRVEGNTAWIQFPGGLDETPVEMSINVSPGDVVNVHVSGGRAWVTGNGTAPPTDNTYAIRSNAVLTESVAEAEEKVTIVQRIVEAVKKIADNTNQYFWHTETGTDTGAHITEIPQEEFLADPDNGGGNLLARSNGIALREGLTELATLQQSGMDVNSYDTQGNLVNIAHLGYGPGTNSSGGTSTAPYYTLGTRLSGSTVGNYSTAEGGNVTASGYSSHAEGSGTTASGNMSHAEGSASIASGNSSHAEGSGTASGGNSHAEGSSCEAVGNSSHAEGLTTDANGDYSHAEGNHTEANGNSSHAQNMYTIAEADYQTAIGKYNVVDYSGDYAVIVGNGTGTSARSNTAAVKWNGDLRLAGEIYTKCDADSSNGNPILTATASESYSSVNVASNSSPASASGMTTICTLKIPAGCWLLDVAVQFAANSTGYRYACMSTSNTGSSIGTLYRDMRPAITLSSTITLCKFSVIVSTQTNLTWYIRAGQNSGSTLAATPRVNFIGHAY